MLPQISRREKIGVGKSGCAGLPSLRTVRAVFPHTARQSVGSVKGLNVSGVGYSQTFVTALAEVDILPTHFRCQTLRIASMTLQKLTSKTLADHPVVLVKDVPRTVSEVGEPTHRVRD